MQPPIKYGPYGQYAQVWGAASASNPTKVYTVALTRAGKWSCSCPVWIYNSSRPECKHIRHVRQYAQGQLGQLDAPAAQPMPAAVSKALDQFSMLDVS